MEIITKKFAQSVNLPKILAKVLNIKKYCFFDIETTGFNKKNSRVILIGLLYLEKENVIIKQYFANTLNQEKQLLEKFKTTIAGFDTLISYNGDTFDIPFLNSRYKYNNFDFYIDKKNSFDLLKIVRKYKKDLKLKNCKLKTVEKSLNINRKDKISGKESIKMYYNYLNNNDDQLKQTILKHNFDDIYYLPKILSIYNIIENKYTLSFKFKRNNAFEEIFVYIDNISIKQNILNIHSKTPIYNVPNQIYYKHNYSLNWQPINGILNLNIHVNKSSLSNGNKCCYVKKENYNLKLDSIDNLNYNLPSNIILLTDKNKLLFNNIKVLVNNILSNFS